MPEQIAPTLCTKDRTQVALQSVSVEVVFNDLFCETTMSQMYRNREKKSIEAVYTFPLASNAVLMGLQVVIGGKKLEGKVVGKASAEEKYEDAIIDGDSAVMLQQIKPGMYTMNVGNIIAGEEISISITYAELFFWQEDTLRFFLPTTIAPRYGRPKDAGLHPHQEPVYDLLAENRFQLKLTISGALVDADFTSPSHQLDISRSQGNVIVTLASGKDFMDRDFIMNIHSKQTEKNTVQVDRDQDNGYVALASFVPILPIAKETVPHNIIIVVDCSGSMNGDSITQARQAILVSLDQLRPEDHFNLITFGNTYNIFFTSQMPASKKNIDKVKRFLRILDADMGGTEIHPALKAATELAGPPIPKDIVLITDGEVWDDGRIIEMAEKSGHRVFTVGVGSSVSENFVRQLAQKTGGACELVTPCENMAEKIIHHFKRIYLPRAEKVAIHWPTLSKKIVPQDLDPVYDGDTLHVFAFFDEKPTGLVTLEMTLADGQTFSQNATISNETTPDIIIHQSDIPSNIARFAIHKSLEHEDISTATVLAIQYQLVSPHTNYLVVAERVGDEKAQELPELRKVPQMLAAGWGGTGSLRLGIPSLQVPSEYLDTPTYLRKKVTNCLVFHCEGFDTLEDSSFHTQNDSSIKIKPKSKQMATPDIFMYLFNRRHKRFPQDYLQSMSFRDLLDRLLPTSILSTLRSIATQYAPEAPEEVIVIAFLLVLVQSSIGDAFDRDTKRAIKKASKVLYPDLRLISEIQAAFTHITLNEWMPYAQNDTNKTKTECSVAQL